jgi:hypothetical protein
MAGEGQLCLFAGGLLRQPRIRISDGGVRPVRPFIAVEITRGIASRTRRLVGAILSSEAGLSGIVCGGSVSVEPSTQR